MSERTTSLISDARATLDTVQELQRRYDDVGWQIQEPSYAKVRHVLLHLMKITAEVARLVENVEHSVHNGVADEEISKQFAKSLNERTDIAGDLLFHAAQFANLGNYALSEALIGIYSRNAKQFAPESEFAGLAVETAGTAAVGA